jgi:hypothetical protein
VGGGFKRTGLFARREQVDADDLGRLGRRRQGLLVFGANVPDGRTRLELDVEELHLRSVRRRASHLKDETTESEKQTSEAPSVCVLCAGG